jgi:hypothetical protein
MTTHVWTIVCRRAVVDQFDNSLSMIDMLEAIGVPTPPPPPADNPKALPAVPVDWYVVSYWRRSDPARPERTTARLKVVAPDGKTVTEITQELVLDKVQNMRGLMRLPVLPLRGAGLYQFVIYAGGGKVWKKVTAVPIVVQYLEPPAGDAAPGKPEARALPAAKRRRAH